MQFKKMESVKEEVSFKYFVDGADWKVSDGENSPLKTGRRL